jgi:hypothetical protein
MLVQQVIIAPLPPRYLCLAPLVPTLLPLVKTNSPIARWSLLVSIRCLGRAPSQECANQAITVQHSQLVPNKFLVLHATIAQNMEALLLMIAHFVWQEGIALQAPLSQ